MFTVGTRPRRLTIEELNQEIPPLGRSGREEELRKIIKASLPPRTAESHRATGRADGLFPWSKPAGGLITRIEYVGSGGYSGFTVLVRLKNISDKLLAVPTGNPANSCKARIFELYAQREGGPWVRRPWFPKEHLEGDGPEIRSDGPTHPIWLAVESGNSRDRPTVALTPGESCLAYLCGTETLGEKKDDAITEAAAVKIILRQPATKENDRWQGVLETLPHPPRMLPERLASSEGGLPMPEYFPALSRVQVNDGQMLGIEPEVWRLYLSNSELTTALTLYGHAEVRHEFEQRMLAEKELRMKLLTAAVAARAGSQAAAMFLLETMKEADYITVRNVQNALRVVLMAYSANPPDWIVELILASLSDRRYVTGMEKTGWGGGTPYTISEVADYDASLTYTLGYSKCRKAVPFLIEMAKRNEGYQGVTYALGEIGDPQAVPVLIQLLPQTNEKVEYSAAAGLPRRFLQTVKALAELRAREAVPLLLQHVEFPAVIEALEKIGDRRAVPAIREIVAARGKVVHDGQAVYPEADQERYVAARLALVALGDRDPVPQLCEMLSDQSLDKFQRITIVWRLSRRPDARAILYLLHVIKTNASGRMRNEAVMALSEFKYKAAVAGLIECFNVDFRSERGFVMAVTLPMVRDNIATSLRSITGQPFGVEKGQWLKWWREKGMSTAGLK